MENKINQWLQGYGIPALGFRYFHSDEEPDEVNSLNVALKIVTGRVVHKTEEGRVSLNLKNKDELRSGKPTFMTMIIA